jgi:hypothetical protein
MIATFDQNNDGWEDVLVGSNVGNYFPASVLINHGSAGFEEAGDVLGGPPAHGLYDINDIDRDGDQDIAAENLILENLKPWNPNLFPVTNLRLQMTLSVSGMSLSQTIDVENAGAASATNVSVSIPVPHGYDWQSTAGDGDPCFRSGHVVQCVRPSLGAGSQWRITVQSSRQATPIVRATHTVASVAADVRDQNLTDNVHRVAIPSN